jgi:DHA2 family multidrug resistance protein
MTAAIMQGVDFTIANVALPYIQGSLSASQNQANWVLTSYIVVAAIMTAPIAWVTERFGRKKLFIACAAGFTFGSLLCGLAQTIEQIVLFRMVQGLFGAALAPLSQAVMLDAYSLHERAWAMAIWSVGMGLGPIMGPALGGWFTDQYSWQWVFLINLPIGVFTVLGLVVFMDETEMSANRRFDWFGFLTLAAGIGTLQLMLDRGEQLGWFSSTEITAECAISIVGFYFFLAHSLTAENSLVRFEIFRDRNFLAGVLLMAFAALALLGTGALASPFLQTTIGYPVMTTGWLLGARGIGTLVSMMATGRLLRVMEARWLLLAGLAVVAGTLYQMELFTDQTPAVAIVTANVIQGLGFGLLLTPIGTIAFLTTESRLRTDGTVMLALIRNTFASIGISLVIAKLTDTTTLMHARLVENVTPFNNALQMPDVVRTISMATESGRALLDTIVNRQAAIIAYANDYKLILLWTLVAMPLVFLVGSTRAVQRPT